MRGLRRRWGTFGCCPAGATAPGPTRRNAELTPAGETSKHGLPRFADIERHDAVPPLHGRTERYPPVFTMLPARPRPAGARVCT
jgi:hypothetical protein